jgi:hypothetical protein
MLKYEQERNPVDLHDPLREQDVLNEALEAVRRTAGVELHIARNALPKVDALVEMDAPTAQARFAAEVKTVRYFATIALAKEQLAHLAPGFHPLLVAPYITRALAERCRELKLPFIDTAGNAYINVPGLTIYVTGEPRPATLTEDPQYRTYTQVGMKVTFALLCEQELANATYREIAKAAQVAFGTVGPVIKDLENRGHLVQRERRKTLANTRDLVEAWVTRYPDVLRPKLFRNRYQADIDRLYALNLRELKAFWGAEVAAQRLTNYLKPEHFTLYIRGDVKPLLTQARMRLDLNGNTELLQAFWQLPDNPAYPDLVPPLLVYADLMATQDGRNLETARLLYERILEPAYRT